MSSNNFITDLFDQVFEKGKRDSGLKRKTEIINYLIYVIDVSKSTIWNIYNDESKNFSANTLNSFSKYLGFENFGDYVLNKNTFLSTLNFKPTEVVFRNSSYENYNYSKKVFLMLRDQPDVFDVRIWEILNFMFNGKKIYQSSNFGTKAFVVEYEKANMVFIPLAFELEANLEKISAKAKIILDNIKRDFEILNSKDYGLSLLTNLIFSEKQKKALDNLQEKVFVNKPQCQIGFLDIEDFIDLYTMQTNFVMDSLLESYNLNYKNKLINNLKTVFYLRDVPFYLSNSEEIKYNPSLLIKSSLVDQTTELKMFADSVFKNSIHNKLSRKINWNIVIGEFGFGKTSLFLNLDKEFLESQYSLFFLPIAQIEENAFDSTDEFIKQLFLILKKDQINYSEVSDLLFYDYLKSLFTKEQRIMFLVDGIDEHMIASNLDGLQKIFDRLNDLQTDCLISVRKEFWDDRKGDLNTVFNNSNKFNSIIELTEWDDKHILDFINKFEKENLLKDELLEFKKLIEKNQYEKFYGDIPKRPLFLQMIVQDILANKINKKSLSELYENYLFQKFIQDRQGVFKDNKSKRFLNLEKQKDRLRILKYIWRVLKLVAQEMVFIDKNKLVLKSTIDEDSLENILNSLDNQISTSEIFLNTVLIPFNSRSVNGLNLTFAHRSFQEYFTALSLKDNLYDYPKSVLIPNEIKRFMN